MAHYTYQSRSSYATSGAETALAPQPTQDKQAALITQNVLQLSTNSTKVSLALDEALDQQLHDELVSKGYSVFTADHQETKDGTTVHTHTVDIALPTDTLVQSKFSRSDPFSDPFFTTEWPQWSTTLPLPVLGSSSTGSSYYRRRHRSYQSSYRSTR